MDASLGRQTEFGVYVEDDEDHQIKSVEFTDADGTTYGPFTKMSSTYDVVNFKTINFNVGEEPPFDDVSSFFPSTAGFADLDQNTQKSMDPRSLELLNPDPAPSSKILNNINKMIIV